MANWEPDTMPGREHISYFYDKATLIVLGKLLPKTSASAKITIMGPASVVTFCFTVILRSDQSGYKNKEEKENHIQKKRRSVIRKDGSKRRAE